MAACLTWQRLVEHHLHLICTGRRLTPPQAPIHRLREGNDHSGIMLHAASDSTDVANKRDHPNGSWCGRCSSPYAANVWVCRLQLPWHWPHWRLDGNLTNILRYNHIQLPQHTSYQCGCFPQRLMKQWMASALDHSTVTCSQEWFCRLLLQ